MFVFLVPNIICSEDKVPSLWTTPLVRKTSCFSYFISQSDESSDFIVTLVSQFLLTWGLPFFFDIVERWFSLGLAGPISLENVWKFYLGTFCSHCNILDRLCSRPGCKHDMTDSTVGALSTVTKKEYKTFLGKQFLMLIGIQQFALEKKSDCIFNMQCNKVDFMFITRENIFQLFHCK